MSNIEKFDVTCKNCESKNVELAGYNGQGMGFGTLECQDCKQEESVDETGNKY